MTRFPTISLETDTALVAATAGRYARSSTPIPLPSSVHTKELRLWGYAA